MTKPIRFSFHNTPTGLRMRNAHPIQSTRALSGMNRVFTRLEQINKAAYEKVRHLDEFSVNLEKQPGSEKYGMRIFAEKVQIHIPNLKPETQKIFLELPPLPSAPPAPLSPDMMSSMGTTVFPQNLLVSFATAISAFWNWIKSLRGNESKKVSFAPDTLDKPSSRLEPKRRTENPLAADPKAVSNEKHPSLSASAVSTRLPVIMLDQEPEAPMMEETPDTLLPPSEMERDPESDGEIYPENREYVDPASQKGQPLERMLQTPDAPLKRYSHSALAPIAEPLLPEDFSSDKNLSSSLKNAEPPIPESPSAPLEYEKLQLPSSTRPKHRGCVILEQEAIKTSAPVPAITAALQETPPTKEEDEFTILDRRKTEPPVAAAAAEPIPTPPQFSAAERQRKDLEFLFLMQFSPTETPDPSSFGYYLLNKIFPMHDLQSCEIDMTTGRFKLTFAKEKTIPLTKLPEGKTETTINNLKHAVGTTLHIGKELKGKINIESITKGEKDYLNFDEGSLTIQWTKWKVPFTCHLLGIQLHPQYSEWLVFKGKFMGKTADRNIRTQDFIDFIECNIAK